MTYKLLKTIRGVPEGTIVHEYLGPTYGLDSMDTFFRKEQHVAVVEEGDVGPFFTVPISALERLENVY